MQGYAQIDLRTADTGSTIDDMFENQNALIEISDSQQGERAIIVRTQLIAHADGFGNREPNLLLHVDLRLHARLLGRRRAGRNRSTHGYQCQCP